jgi:hypothetical protein
MKTSRPYTASFNLLGALLVVSLLSSALMGIKFQALIELLQACESQLLHGLEWINSGMMLPHQ